VDVETVLGPPTAVESVRAANGRMLYRATYSRHPSRLPPHSRVRCLSRRASHGQCPHPVIHTMRVVSLIASATETIYALGCDKHLVGRSHECDFPHSVRSLPVCTEHKFDISGSSAEIDRRVKDALRESVSVYRVFPDVLDELAPDVIVTQAHCDVCAVSLKDVGTGRGANGANEAASRRLDAEFAGRRVRGFPANRGLRWLSRTAAASWLPRCRPGCISRFRRADRPSCASNGSIH